MSLEIWMLFITVCFVASMTPGPGILSVITYSVSYGTKRSIPIILGILSGLFFLALMAIMGLGVVLESSREVFLWLQYIGAAYLCYIGVKTFRAQSEFSAEKSSENLQQNFTRLYLHGIGVSVVNPKALGFFSALFLPFISPNGNTYSQFLILLITLLCCSAFSLFFYSIGAEAVSPMLKKYANAFNKVTGGCFIGLSIMLATSSSKT